MNATATTPFKFSLNSEDKGTRTGIVSTARGDIRTPAFMPVGTAATVKALYMDQVRDAGADIILGNTYHLMLRPGAERIDRLGGLHKFCGWSGPMLTDSGGFQVMSLSALRKLDENGVTFKSHIDGQTFHMSPERSIEIQGLLGSDIQMQLDECISLPAEASEIERAMELSLRWAERSARAFEFQGEQASQERAMFGIVQGGDNAQLRSRSARELADMNLKGYAVGGLAVGEPQEVMMRVLEATTPLMPSDKPRYLMGVGTPDDILKSVARGIDMFDCVMPTRAGRHGLAYTRFGKVNLKNARHAEDPRPLDEVSSCPATAQYSRAYLHHLVKCNEALAGMLLSWNNIAYYQYLMDGIRNSIANGSFDEFDLTTREMWERGDIDAL